MTVHPQLIAMKDVQDLEKELIALKGKAEAISIPLERTRARRHAARKDLISRKEKLDRTIQDRREKERELGELETKLDAAQTRLSSARNAKEAQAHEAEIERMAAARDTAENDALELLDKEEHLTMQLDEASTRTNRDFEQIDAELERLEGLLGENQALAKGLREDRITALNRLDSDIREHYAWLIKRYGAGQAVARADGGACGGCGSMLLPDQAMKVDDLSTLHKCSHCARYLGGRE